MIYVIDDDKVIGEFSSINMAQKIMGEDVAEKYKMLKDIDMKYISRITYVDDVCVYNDKQFWTKDLTDILENYNNHRVVDILNQPVSLRRFETEQKSNLDRIALIDGRPGQISYNMEVGKEFVSLFREECILTKFTKESDTSPMIIFEKLTPVIAMLDAGAFREAKQYLAGYRQMLKDDFLTDERIDKYIAMLDAADAIEYATEEDYFYTAPEVVNDSAV